MANRELFFSLFLGHSPWSDMSADFRVTRWWFDREKQSHPEPALVISDADETFQIRVTLIRRKICSRFMSEARVVFTGDVLWKIFCLANQDPTRFLQWLSLGSSNSTHSLPSIAFYITFGSRDLRYPNAILSPPMDLQKNSTDCLLL